MCAMQFNEGFMIQRMPCCSCFWIKEKVKKLCQKITSHKHIISVNYDINLPQDEKAIAKSSSWLKLMEDWELLKIKARDSENPD